jgi:hypothetical protein
LSLWNPDIDPTFFHPYLPLLSSLCPSFATQACTSLVTLLSLFWHLECFSLWSPFCYPFSPYVLLLPRVFPSLVTLLPPFFHPCVFLLLPRVFPSLVTLLPPFFTLVSSLFCYLECFPLWSPFCHPFSPLCPSFTT